MSQTPESEADPLIERIVVARAFDADAFLAALNAQAITPVIPSPPLSSTEDTTWSVISITDDEVSMNEFRRGPRHLGPLRGRPWRNCLDQTQSGTQGRKRSRCSDVQ